jgi:membrane protein YqaA with SNARE-associated domain
MFILVYTLGALSQFIITAVEELGYLGIFIGMVLSSTPLPFPSEIIMPYAGYVVWRGDLTLIGVTFAGTFGCLAGSLLDYAIGIYGGRPFLERYGKYILVHESRLDDAERWFSKYGGRTVLICKLLPLTGVYISRFWPASSEWMQKSSPSIRRSGRFFGALLSSTSVSYSVLIGMTLLSFSDTSMS